MRSSRYKIALFDEDGPTDHRQVSNGSFRLEGEEVQEVPPSRYFRHRSDARSSSRWVVRFADPLRVKWDLLTIALAGYSSIAIPYQVSFEPASLGTTSIQVLNGLVSIVFTLNIFLNFRTTCISRITGDEIFDTSQIALTYLRSGRFVLDLLVCLPLDLLYINEDRRILLISLVRVVKVFQVSKIIANMKIRNDIKIVAKLTRLLFFLALYVHCIACFWNLIVINNDSWRPPVDGAETDFYDSDTSLVKKYMFTLCDSIYFLRGVETNPSNTEKSLS
jgi:hypothetical protein